MTNSLWIALLLFTHALHFMINVFIRAYYKNVTVPVWREHGPYAPEWKDFIIRNINSCIHADQCYHCKVLIEMYDEMFKSKMPKHSFDNSMEEMNIRLKNKFQALSEGPEISDIKIDDFINQ